MYTNKIWKIGESAIIIKMARDTAKSRGITDEAKIQAIVINDLCCNYESLLEQYLKENCL
jgi:hypothetical protein